jgi:glyoxylase-like metal-dependent hydrolase (beta-lactamase superfamily II)
MLGWGVVAMAAPALGLVPGIAMGARSRLTVSPLGGRLSLITGGAANIVVASAGSELLLVDGGAAADAGQLSSLLADHFPGQKLKAVINTHWHWAQTGFNALARRAGADVLAHENTRLWLSTEVNSRWEGKVYKPQPAEALPNRTFYYGPQSLPFEGGAVEYVHLGQAHTDGDVYVRFAAENVIVAGDVVSLSKYPVIDSASNGWLGGIQGALRTLAARCDAGTRVIPAVGQPVGVDALKQQQEMCYSVVSRIGENYYKGGTFEELVASLPTKEFNAQYGDPALFLKQAYETAWYHVNEIRRVTR